MKMQCTHQLKELTSKKKIFFTDRGNSSILLAMRLAKYLGKTRAVIQDQGGWITYGQYIRKLKLEPVVLETDYGLIDAEKLEALIDDKSFVLMNSMPAYFALHENMKKISEICRKKGAFLINDASGSIGTDAATYGDLVLGSFSEWKPIEVKYGGYIAFDSDYEQFFSENFKKELKDFLPELKAKLDGFQERLGKLYSKAEIVKKQLKGFDVLHRDKKGINVIVRFNSDDEQLRIIDFCKVYGYEFVQCPMYIKVLENAISIELIRLS